MSRTSMLRKYQRKGKPQGRFVCLGHDEHLNNSNLVIFPYEHSIRVVRDTRGRRAISRVHGNDREMELVLPGLKTSV